MTFEITGYEKVHWEYHETEYYEEDGQQLSRQVVKDRKDDKTFFKDQFNLIDYPGGFPVGQFSYPFQYHLPANLPGCFKKTRKSGLKLKAKVLYKIKCTVDIPGPDLKIKQHLVIHEKLDRSIAPQHYNKGIEVKTLCCIPRGPASCECYLDKNAYMSGETAQIHVKVQNNSAVDITNFKTKLIRELTLTAHGHKQTWRDVITQAVYPGTPKHTNKETDVPLPLISKKHHSIAPFTNSGLVKCNYIIMIEMAIPWAPDLEIFSPVPIYAAQNQAWAQWAPPAWVAGAQVQQVCSQLMVPPEVLQAQMQQGQQNGKIEVHV
eukprot:TRINITY_DN1936_c0_g1_i1.p1 TRINITY_DN1936_c0_g1~~TRINITY_DN1936_c0_g1_i1.p1  ORF type:complete len:320 (+),score=75.70 TRINITY_DN1936_c0_g1_i1:210-1169(+)